MFSEEGEAVSTPANSTSSASIKHEIGYVKEVVECYQAYFAVSTNCQRKAMATRAADMKLAIHDLIIVIKTE